MTLKGTTASLAECPKCKAEMAEKTNGRGYAVLACKRGCSSYITMDLETGLLLQKTPVNALVAAGSSENIEARSI